MTGVPQILFLVILTGSFKICHSIQVKHNDVWLDNSPISAELIVKIILTTEEDILSQLSKLG